MRKSVAKFAPLPLRFMIGFAFLYHGFPKLFTALGHAQFMGALHQIGIPAAGLMSWMVAGIEFFGGLALIAGAFTTITSFLLILEMLVALFKVHLAMGFNFIHITGITAQGPQFGLPGYEVNLSYIAGLLSLMLSGAGTFSVDEARKRHEAKPEKQTVVTPEPENVVRSTPL
jgi:putative oxidoreductase